jgi:hypothetical protein
VQIELTDFSVDCTRERAADFPRAQTRDLELIAAERAYDRPDR